MTPIDTDIEERKWCYGKQEIITSPKYCAKECCYIERMLCFDETVSRLDKEIGDAHE